MNARLPIQIALTPEQMKQIEQLRGQQVPAVKLSLETLEERLAPSLGGN
jgi:hypothetical protein